MEIVNVVGYLATVLSSIGLLPQVIKTVKTRSTKDFSTSMLLLSSTSSVIWLVYGLMLVAIPVILANGIVLSCWFIILYFKLQYK